MLHPTLTDLGVEDGQSAKVGQPLQMSQPRTGDRRLAEDQCVKMPEFLYGDHLLIDPSLGQIGYGDVGEVVGSEEIHQPFGPPGLPLGIGAPVLHLPVVLHAAASPYDRRHCITQDLDTLDDPAQRTAEAQDQDDQPTKAEAQLAPPGTCYGVRRHEDNAPATDLSSLLTLHLASYQDRCVLLQGPFPRLADLHDP